MITLGEIMEHASELAPLPQTACKLAALVADDRCSIDQIAEVIEYDQVLTVDILRLANSVASASQRRIDTVRGAVIRMGAAKILERVIGAHVHTTMKEPIAGYGYFADDLWRHSVAAAVVAENLGTFSTTAVAGVSFTAALLHDIGKLLIGRVIGDDELHAILQSIDKEQGESFESAERKRLGYSHAQIGAQICASWNLPETIINAIRDHHRLDDNTDPVTDCVRLCNLTAKIIGEGIGHEGMAFIIDTNAARRFGFCRESYEAFCANVKDRFNTVIESYST